MQTPKQIREKLKNEIDNLMGGDSYSLILTVNKKEGLVITSGAIGLKPDYKELGKALYCMMERDDDYAEKLAEILQGMDEMLATEQHGPVLMVSPSRTRS